MPEHRLTSDLFDPDRFFCHYTRADTAFTHILPSGLLMMNPYARMRDPLENKEPRFHEAFATVVVRPGTKAKMQIVRTRLPNDTSAPRVLGEPSESDQALADHLSRVGTAIRRSRDGVHLLSLTAGETGAASGIDRIFLCPWSRPRMWEQYAENHAGACLVFDRLKLQAAIRQDLQAHGRYWEGDVKYTPAGFAASAGARIGSVKVDVTVRATDEALADDVRRHVVEHHRDFFFLKTADWATEQEYRFVFEEAIDQPKVPAERTPAYFVPYGDSLMFVIVGERFSAWQVDGARNVTHAAGAQFTLMEWQGGVPNPSPC